MTWSANFKVSDVSENDGVTAVTAEASVEEGSLNQNTEHCTKMTLVCEIDGETALKAGDVFYGSGHFQS